MPVEWITAELVARLVATQFPPWAGLPVTPVDTQGWDNRTFRLGDDMSVRLPSAVGYTGAVAKEHAWLPRLAPHLPLPIPAPLAVGAPDDTYPWPWSVRSWLPGRPAAPGGATDLRRLAEDLAEFLLALQRVDTAGAPAAGEQSSHRGGDLAVYGDQTRTSLGALGEREHAARTLWDEATSTTWDGAPVWFHGDVSAGNLLVDGGGRLTAVIDFGQCGIGDPSCDLAVAWTLLDAPGRAVLRERLGPDDGTWDRGRGWALWKAVITLGERPAEAGRTLRELLVADRG